MELRELSKEAIEAGLNAWKELCALLAAVCGKSGGRLECRQPDETSVLIQEKQPPRALRLEYVPQFRKLRYNTGISGWQELTAVEGAQKTVVFETPYHRQYTVQQVCDMVLEQLGKSQF